MNYCNLEEGWYAVAWIPLCIYLSLTYFSGKRVYQLLKGHSPSASFCATSAYVMLVVSLTLRCIWLFDFENCRYTLGNVALTLLTRIPQILWLCLFTTVLVAWHNMLQSTILGNPTQFWVSRVVIWCTVVLSSLSIGFVIARITMENKFIAGRILLSIWAVAIVIAGSALGIPTMRTLKQLTPLSVAPDDKRLVLRKNIKRTLFPASMAVVCMTVLSIIHLARGWTIQDNPNASFCYRIMVYAICEPSLAIALFHGLNK